MTKPHIKKGDEVVVISGAERGKQGKVIAVYPNQQRVIIEGVRMIKKHMKKNQQHPQGAIIEREGTMHISNVMKADKHAARQQKRTPAETAG